MSIADHFEHAPDAGFVRNFDTSSARRQFSVSLILIVVIAVAASALGLFIDFDHQTDERAASTHVMPSYVGSLASTR